MKFFEKLHDKIKKHTPSGKKLERQIKIFQEQMAYNQKFNQEYEKKTQEWEISYHEECRKNGTQPHYHFAEAPAGNRSHPLADRNPKYETSACHLKLKM